MSDEEMDMENSLWATYDMFLAEIEYAERDYDSSNNYFGSYFDSEEEEV